MQLTSDKAYLLRLNKRAQAGLIRGCYSRELAEVRKQHSRISIQVNCIDVYTAMQQLLPL